MLRAVAFATALRGESFLLKGDLAAAESELQEAVDLHRDIGSTAGEAHSLQRLAEVKLALGERVEANRLLHKALPLARFSSVSMHLIQRVFGTMIAAAADADAARTVVHRAEAAVGFQDRCSFCSVMLAVPAAIACADVGDIQDAERHLQVAEKSAAMWDGTAWQAALLEARAHLSSAQGRDHDSAQLLSEAAELFEESVSRWTPPDAGRRGWALGRRSLEGEQFPVTASDCLLSPRSTDRRVTDRAVCRQARRRCRTPDPSTAQAAAAGRPIRWPRAAVSTTRRARATNARRRARCAAVCSRSAWYRWVFTGSDSSAIDLRHARQRDHCFRIHGGSSLAPRRPRRSVMPRP